MVTTAETRTQILAAGKRALLESGYAGLSTRRIAEAAGVPLSQIHYHFGSRQNLVLALLAEENAMLLERQARLYGAELPLWRQWEQACDFLEDDLRSGYVRVLQEMTAAGWSDEQIAEAVRDDLRGWFELLTETATKVAPRLGGFGPLSAAEVAALIGATFLGIETMLLLGVEEHTLPCRSALRSIGFLLRTMEVERARARSPDTAGQVVRDGVSIGYEVFGTPAGDGRPSIVLLPTWTIIHSRFWKLQVPFLARHFHVVVYDGPGNGSSQRVTDPARYTPESYAADAAAVLDACGVERAVAVGLSRGAWYAIELATLRPDVIAGLVLVGAALPLAPALPQRAGIAEHFLDPAPLEPSGWDRYNLAYWHAHYGEFARWFFEQAFSEPHSTKGHDDAVGWAMETGAEVLGAEAAHPPVRRQVADLLAELRCPTLVVHGSDDRIIGHDVGIEAARLSNGTLLSFEGSGHLPNLRDPVRFNLVLREFVERVGR